MKIFLLACLLCGFFFAAPAKAADVSSSGKSTKKTVSFTDQVFKTYEVKGKFRVSFLRNPAIYEVRDKNLQKALKESQSKKSKLVIEADPFELTIEKAKVLK